MRIPHLRLIVFLWMVTARLFPDGPPPRPGREVSLPQDEVKDTFFAYVIGVVRSGAEVDMDNAALMDVLTEFKTHFDLPFDKIERVVQARGASEAGGSLSIMFNEPDVRIPIPFSFLGYHPGAILASQTVTFTETRTVLPNAVDPRFTDPLYLLPLTDGYITIKVDEWLKFLFPTLVDDLYVSLIAIFRSHGDWICLLSGMGGKGKPVREFFSFTHNHIIFPIPAELAKLAEAISQSPVEETVSRGAPSR